MQLPFTLIDVALLVGAVLSLFSGVGRVLRPQQKRQIQNFFEEVTHSVEHATAPSPRRHLQESGVQIFLLSVFWLLSATSICLIFGFGSAVNFPGIALLMSDESVPEYLKEYMKADIPLSMHFMRMLYLVTCAGLISSLVTLILSTRNPTMSKLWSWTIAPDRAVQIRKRIFAIFFTGYLLSMLADITIRVSFLELKSEIFVVKRQYGNLHVSYEGPTPEMSVYFFILYTILMSFMFSLMSFVCCGMLGAAIVNGKRSTSLRLFIKFSRAVLWRGMERQKGSVAAIVLVIAIILWAFRIYSR